MYDIMDIESNDRVIEIELTDNIKKEIIQLLFGQLRTSQRLMLQLFLGKQNIDRRIYYI